MSRNQRMPSPWVILPKPNTQASIRLFCFPFAGGTARAYAHWPERLPEFVEVCAVQLPGRDSRMRERSYTRMKNLAEDAGQALSPFMDRPFVFFGHSLGALIAFELTRFLRREGASVPLKLLLSGRDAPQIVRAEKRTYVLPEAELKEELRRLNGTPKGVLDNAELLRLMLPFIRADFEVNETYAYVEEPPLDRPFTVLGGLGDAETTRESLEAWGLHTNATFRIHMLPGDHFFIQTDEARTLEIISRELYEANAALFGA